MRTRNPARLLAFTAVAAAGIALVGVGAGAGQAADPFVAGERSTRNVAIGGVDAGRALGRAAELSRALGLPGTTRAVTRLDDRFEHQVYDEVVARDGAGRQVAIARFGTDGRVVMAVALGWNRSAAVAVGRDAASARAAATVRAAGLRVQGPPSVDAVSSGWSVRWRRIAAGAPVLGDGVRVLLWPDGSFHGLAVSERPLAAAPKHAVKVAQARRVADRAAAGRYGAAAKDLSIQSAQLAWVAPNDAWNAAAPDAPGQTLRLAWVVALAADGALAERVRGLQVWVDATDGRIIGGDVLE
jgi:hypothetical protein